MDTCVYDWSVGVAGFDSTIGFTAWSGNPAAVNCSVRTVLDEAQTLIFGKVVETLIAAGAIPLVKTNVPQTMLAFECSNPLWGRTTNPYNDAYTCGGSSGGEAALLAMDGSAFGIGTDIGGSLRIPSTYCGVYSLKPGKGRMSMFGAKGYNSALFTVRLLIIYRGSTWI